MSRGPTRTGLTQHAGSSRIVPVGLRSREIVRITVRPPLAGGPRAGHPAQTAAFTNPDAVTSPFLPIVFPWTVSAEARDRRPVDARCSTRRTRSTDPVAWTRAGRHEHQPSREQPLSELAEHAAPKRQGLPGVRVPPSRLRASPRWACQAMRVDGAQSSKLTTRTTLVGCSVRIRRDGGWGLARSNPLGDVGARGRSSGSGAW
jgi:hypothetical protein